MTNLVRLRAGRRSRACASGLVALMLGLAACGKDDADSSTTAAGTRTVELEMVDNAFQPTDLEVEAGATVRFVFRNEGAVVHDAVIGDEPAQEAHEEEMRAEEDSTVEATDGEMDGMGHGSTSDDDDDEAALTVAPGKQGELTYTFDSAGEVLIGCHEPGHYDAGMKVAVRVE